MNSFPIHLGFMSAPRVGIIDRGIVGHSNSLWIKKGFTKIWFTITHNQFINKLGSELNSHGCVQNLPNVAPYPDCARIVPRIALTTPLNYRWLLTIFSVQYLTFAAEGFSQCHVYHPQVITIWKWVVSTQTSPWWHWKICWLSRQVRFPWSPTSR